MQMNISLVQLAVSLGEPEKNFTQAVAALERAVRNAPTRPDILVLPETLNTGFYPHADLREIADEEGRRTQEVFGNFARSHQVNIVAGSVTTLRDGQLFNTSYAFDRTGGVVNRYDKIHRFTPADEHAHYEAGNSCQLFTLDGIRCATMICYDLRFPELFRSLALQGAELFFLPAEWPTPRVPQWNILLRARAIENQAYLCAVNGCGYVDADPKLGHFGGHSALVNALGEDIVTLGSEPSIAYGSIDTDRLATIRQRIPTLVDRRPDTYTL